MAEQPLAGPAPAPALVFTAREPSELLKQRYGENEEFLEVPYLPPSLAGAFAGGYKDTEGKIVFPRSMIAAMALGLFWRGGAWSGVPGVGARCGNGLFSTYKSPKILS